MVFFMFYVFKFSIFDFSKVKNIEVFYFVNYGDGQYIVVEMFEFFFFDDNLNLKKVVDLDIFEVKDMIGFFKFIFFKIVKKGEFKKGVFWIGLKVYDKDDWIIYDKKVGDFYYDMDGLGICKVIKFVDVDKKLKMMVSDFYVF